MWADQKQMALENILVTLLQEHRWEYVCMCVCMRACACVHVCVFRDLRGFFPRAWAGKGKKLLISKGVGLYQANWEWGPSFHTSRTGRRGENVRQRLVLSTAVSPVCSQRPGSVSVSRNVTQQFWDRIQESKSS